MNIQKIATATLLIGLGALTSSLAFAAQEKTNIGLDLHENTDSSVQENLQIHTKTSADIEEKDDTTMSESDSSHENENEKNDNHSTMGETHRSTVATFVQNLLHVADKEGNIGVQIKAIAQAQNDSQQVTTDAIVKVEDRSKLKTFLIGSDYKNLGVLRSQVVITANQINQLKNLVEQTTDATDKATLQEQIQVLEQNQVDMNTFITQNESKFSLFGWMFRGKDK